MADSTETKKRTLTAEQKEKMRLALEAKRADPAWQEEQKRKREERKAAKAAAKALVGLKHDEEDKPKNGKKSKKTTDDTTKKKPSAWDNLTPEQREERLAKMKAGKEAKKAEFKLTPEERKKMLDAFDDDVLEGTSDKELKQAYDALMKKRAGRKVHPMPKDE